MPLAKIQALADPTRFAVFECIRCCETSCAEGACTFAEESEDLVAVCDVRCQVECAPSTMTHHLNILRDAGLIETERRGRNLYARVNPHGLAELSQFFANSRPSGAASACECGSCDSSKEETSL